jgi:hypothetical protein
MQPEELFSLVFIIGMFMGVFIIYMGLRQRSEQLQMRHRERMAMIEKGQIPLNESSAGSDGRHRQVSPPSTMSLSIGIIVVGIGLRSALASAVPSRSSAGPSSPAACLCGRRFPRSHPARSIGSTESSDLAFTPHRARRARPSRTCPSIHTSPSSYHTRSTRQAALRCADR